MTLRLRARPGDRTVADVLGRETGGEGAEAAVAEGRVFSGRRRVADAARPVEPGEELVVHAPRQEPSGVRVLGERQGLLAAYKPPGLPTEPDRRGGASLVRALARLIGAPARDLHAATRLDAKVSGVVVVARGADGRRLARTLQDEGRLHRRYVALVGGALEPEGGDVTLPIGEDARGRPVASGRNAREAATRFERLAVAPGRDASLVAFEPLTGRTHQIRIHAASLGAPILGDVEHGGARRLVLPTGTVLPLPRVCLHALRVSVVGPGGEPEWSVEAPLPADLVEIWAALGGHGAGRG